MRAMQKKTQKEAKEVILANVHGSKYRIPINHPILNDHGVFYPKALENHLIFEITLAPINNILIYSDTTKTPSYSIKNLELEYSSISSEYLAREAQSTYQVGKGFFYENITLHKTFTFSIGGDGVINQHINLPRRSMTGVLFLFLITSSCEGQGILKIFIILVYLPLKLMLMVCQIEYTQGV